jgi:hypothetical protein
MAAFVPVPLSTTSASMARMPSAVSGDRTRRRVAGPTGRSTPSASTTPFTSDGATYSPPLATTL